MSYLIRELPNDERPRERFINYGVEALSNEELLSILIRTGTKNKSVKDVSMELLREVSINDFANINYNYLKNIKGIGSVKAITIMCAIEFGKRVYSFKNLIYKINNSDDLFLYVKDEMSNKLQERFMAVFLNNKAYVIDHKIIFMGTVNYSLVIARDVFREAVKSNATSMLLVHNHPGGSLEPSYDDIEITRNFIEIGKLLEIPVMEHIIVGNNNYYSFRNNMGDLFEKNNKHY